MNIESRQSVFDIVSDLTLLIFMTILLAFGPDNRVWFIPAEILFVSVFALRFFIKRSKFTLFTVWGLGYIALSWLSIVYATSRPMALARALSVVQVVVFGNLVAPYLGESKRNFNLFLNMILGAVGMLAIRLLISAPIQSLMTSRLGPTVGINANELGLAFAIAGLVALYFSIVKKKYYYLVLTVLFMLISLFSGSRKVIAVLVIGVFGLVFFSRRRLIESFGLLFLAVVIIGGVLFLSFKWEPLYAIIGSRVDSFFAFFRGDATDISTFTRFNMIGYGLKMFLQKPLLGWGLGAFTDVAGFGFYSHDNFVELLVSLGFVGFAWYYSLYVGIFVRGISQFFHAKKQEGLILSLVIIMILGFDDFGRVRMYSEFSQILYALCYVGIARQDAKAGVDIFQLWKKVKEFARYPRKAVLHILKWKTCRLLPDTWFVSIKYRMIFKKKLLLHKPLTYNEKIQWLKVHDHNPLYPTLVDKYAVRAYIASRIGESCLVPLLGMFEDPKQIDFSALPDQFVLKPTHTSGDVLICLDKSNFNWEKALLEMQHWMQINYYWYDREWPYKDVEPRIVCEPYLVDESGYELKDYKVFTFDGIPRLIQVDWDRFTSHKRNLYTPEWEYCNLQLEYPTDPHTKIQKPLVLDRMLELSRVLSKGFSHLRVDFYVLGEQLYIGELTLYHGSGFEKITPMQFEREMGDWLHLPETK